MKEKSGDKSGKEQCEKYTEDNGRDCAKSEMPDPSLGITACVIAEFRWLK